MRWRPGLPSPLTPGTPAAGTTLGTGPWSQAHTRLPGAAAGQSLRAALMPSAPLALMFTLSVTRTTTTTHTRNPPLTPSLTQAPPRHPPVLFEPTPISSWLRLLVCVFCSPGLRGPKAVPERFAHAGDVAKQPLQILTPAGGGGAPARRPARCQPDPQPTRPPRPLAQGDERTIAPSPTPRGDSPRA